MIPETGPSQEWEKKYRLLESPIGEFVELNVESVKDDADNVVMAARWMTDSCCYWICCRRSRDWAPNLAVPRRMLPLGIAILPRPFQQRCDGRCDCSLSEAFSLLQKNPHDTSLWLLYMSCLDKRLFMCMLWWPL